MHRVSIIIPMYNAEDTIIRALLSVRRQSYQNYEVIIVDDGSTDRSVELAQSFISEHALDPTWKVMHQENSGPSVARNQGMDRATGEYIAFLDADDEWLPEKLTVQVAYIDAEPNLWLIGSPMKYTTKYKTVSLRQLLFKNYFPTSTVLLRNAGGYRFNTQQKYSEDYRLWLKVASEHPCGIHPGPLTIYDGGVKQSRRSGLSTHKKVMEQGELSNFAYLLREGKIYRWEYVLCSTLSVLKFIVRWLQ